MSQNMDALAKANTVRMARAELKRELRAMSLPDARIRLAELTEEHDSILGRMRLLDALMVPMYACERQARAVMRHAGVRDQMRRVEELTERQVEQVSDELRLQAGVARRWSVERAA
jgi:hypothetical protein